MAFQSIAQSHGIKIMNTARQVCQRLYLSVACTVLAISAHAQQAVDPNRFTPFEQELDAIAKKFTGNTDIVLERLNQLKLSVTNDDNLAVLSAFQCDLFRARGELHRLDDLILKLNQQLQSNERNNDLRAALELCKLYRNEKSILATSQVATAYQYARFAKSATLRFLISTMYIEFTGAQGRAQDAVNAAQLALTIAQVNNDAFRQSLALRALAAIELDYGDKEAALDYINQTIALAQNFPNQQLMLLYQFNRAGILIAMKRLMEARGATQVAEQMAAEMNRDLPKEMQNPDLPILMLANSIELAYLEGDYSTAKKQALALEAMATKPQMNLLKASAQISIALASIRLGSEAAIESHFKKGIQTFIDLKRPVEVRDGYEKLAQALASIGNYKEAYNALLSKDETIHNIAKESRDHRAVEVREMHNASLREKENNELKILNTKQQAEVDSANLRLQRWWLFAALLALGLTWAAQMIWMSKKRNSRLQELNLELDEQRLHDPLTGLKNRRYLMQQQPALWDKIRNQAKLSQQSAMLLVDADHFKRINDVYGHHAGDAALIEIAKRLRNCIRETDLCVRWGGEEFLLYIDSSDHQQVQALAQRLMQEIKLSPLDYDGVAIALSISIGYVMLPLTKAHAALLDLEACFKLVDAALYLAKHRGRNRAVGLHAIYAQSQDPDRLARELDSAWNAGELDLVITEGPA